MRRYHVTLTGLTPLLMHWDNIDWADLLDAWKADPANKNASKAGDDRTPAWRWIGYTYHDGQHVAIPSDNLMTCLREGGAMVPVPGGKGGKTFKTQTQTGITTGEPAWKLTIPAGLVPIADIEALTTVSDFSAHKAAVSQLGFSLSVKRAKIGTAKHVRVRPRFDAWVATGSLAVIDDQITEPVLRDILTYAGRFKGLGDWRPSSPKPGTYGMFSAEVREI